MVFPNDFKFMYLYNLIAKKLKDDIFVFGWHENMRHSKIHCLLLSYAPEDMRNFFRKYKKELNDPALAKKGSYKNFSETECNILAEIGQLELTYTGGNCRCACLKINHHSLEKVFEGYDLEIITEYLNSV